MKNGLIEAIIYVKIVFCWSKWIYLWGGGLVIKKQVSSIE